MLPSYPDCARRTAAKQYRKQFVADGYEFRTLPPSVGSAAGTAVHKGAEVALRARWARQRVTADDILQPAFAAFHEETDQSCIWDDTTPNRNVAEQQIRSMIQAYLQGPGKSIVPATLPNGEPAIELPLEANAGDGWILTGTMDICTDGWVRDLKTGALVRPYHAQLGGYSLLVRSHKIIENIEGCCIDFIKRAGKTKVQPECVTCSYPVVPCQSYALGIIDRIKKDMAKYLASGDLNKAFPANPMSMMCSEKYCPCFGTAFCELSGQ